jgi:outer membrane biosynthesis protein TonB
MEKNIKDKTPINTLPEYQIRTMKDDLAGRGLGKEVRTKKGTPPEKLPVAPEKISLPGIEELIAKEEKTVKGKKVKKRKPAPRPKPKQPKTKPKPVVILIIIAIILAGIALFFYWQGLKPWTSPSEEQSED